MIKTIKRLAVAASATLAIPLLVMAPMAHAASSTVVVTGNTVNTTLGENGSKGWWFNRDSNTTYSFVTGNEKIGVGSLYVSPVSFVAADKFVGEYFALERMGNVQSFSFDFKTDSLANEAKANQFYLNVYTNFAESSPTKYYDCRYDISATSGSSTSYNTVTFNVGTAASVTQRNSSPSTCPATPSDMGDNAYIRAFSINLGDSSATDSGVGGYFDNVVYTTNMDTTTFDFEPVVQLINKDQCKNGGWMTSNAVVFKNQGDCVSSFASKGKANGNPVTNFLKSIF